MEIGGGKYRSSWRPATFPEPRVDTSVVGYYFASQIQAAGVRLKVVLFHNLKIWF